MKESGHRVDMMLFSLDSLNSKQAAKLIPISVADSLYSPLSPYNIANPLKKNSQPLNFTLINEYRDYQEKIYRLGDSLEEESIKDYRQKADSLINAYNRKARMHNSFIKGFPRNIYSSLFKFQAKAYL